MLMTFVKWAAWPLFFGLWLLAGMVWWKALLAAAVSALLGEFVAGKTRSY